MRAYSAIAERIDTGYLIDLPSLNWQFTFHGPRAGLEDAVRSEIERVTGDKGFGVAYNFEEAVGGVPAHLP